MLFKVNFNGNINLSYKLIDHEIVYKWASLLENRNTSHLSLDNHYIGYVTEEFLNSRIDRLYQLADYINENTPERVVKLEINKETYQDALNTMHVHFPELKNDIKYKHIWDYLTEYNDIIHWLESTVKSVWEVSDKYNSRFFRITLDFNKSGTEFVDIPESAYTLFDPDVLFGQLKIHYTHVGKNAQELFTTRDMICPSDQFVPQRTFNASCRMYFTDDFYINRQAWNNFYKARGVDFWKLDIDDPKLAFGYMKIGQLTNINIDDTSVDIPISQLDRHNFRNKLVDTKVVGWEIIKGD